MTDLSETFKRLERDPQGGAQHLTELLESFLLPLLHLLDEVLDKRLVRTFLQCLVAMIRLRNNAQALWLSELGAYLQGYEGYSGSAPAGTKRVGKLLRSVKWTAGLIDRYLLQCADEEVKKLHQQGQRILCLWDGSVVEKAESEKSEGLCPVLSSKAKRRQRTRTGLRVQLACGAAGARDGDAMECWADRRNEWAPSSGGDQMVDDERRLCHQTARCRRRAVARYGQAMGTVAASRL